MERNERTSDDRFVIIDDIYAWLSIAQDGSEGIIAWSAQETG